MEHYIKFMNVGRKKYCGEKLLPEGVLSVEAIEQSAYDEARKHLVSSEISTAYDEKKNEGTVFVGFARVVGKFTVIEKGKG